MNRNSFPLFPRQSAAILGAFLVILIPTRTFAQLAVDGVSIGNPGAYSFDVGVYTADGTYGGGFISSFDSDTRDENVQSLALSGGNLFVGYGDGLVSRYSTTGSVVNASLLTVSGTAYVGANATNLFVDHGGTIGSYGLDGSVVNASLISGLGSSGNFAVSGSNLYLPNAGKLNAYSTVTGNLEWSVNDFSAFTGTSLAVSGGNLFVSNGQNVSVYAAADGTQETYNLLSGTLGSGNNVQALAVVGSDLFISLNANQYGQLSEYTTSGVLLHQDYLSGIYPTASLLVGQPLYTGPPPVAVTPASQATTVAAHASYATVAPVTSTGGLGTTVSIAAGTSTSGNTVTLATTNLGANYYRLASDVVSISGNDGDIFTAQLIFNLGAANVVGGGTQITLLWLNPSTGLWENAVLGDHGTNNASGLQLGYTGSFAAFQATYGTDLTQYLGAYGVDTSGNTVWAVIDHNSNFGAGNVNEAPSVSPAPEPSTWMLGVLGLAVLFGVQMRRRVFAQQA